MCRLRFRELGNNGLPSRDFLREVGVELCLTLSGLLGRGVSIRSGLSLGFKERGCLIDELRLERAQRTGRLRGAQIGLLLMLREARCRLTDRRVVLLLVALACRGLVSQALFERFPVSVHPCQGGVEFFLATLCLVCRRLSIRRTLLLDARECCPFFRQFLAQRLRVGHGGRQPRLRIALRGCEASISGGQLRRLTLFGLLTGHFAVLQS